MEPAISLSVDVAAPPMRVWALVSDLPGMGAFSPENVGGQWGSPRQWGRSRRGRVDGEGPQVGAHFRGVNRNGRRQWETNVVVAECEPGRLFTFDVWARIGVRVSRWSYVITPTPDGCTLTESWYRVGSAFVRRFLGPRVTGRADRPGYNVTSIEHTLAAVKAAAETSGAEYELSQDA